jgi:molybdate transport system regulatory protein
MSYRRAWMLVDDIDSIFGTRIVDLKVGGREGNGCLASLGLAVNECYRALERAAADAAQPHLAALQAEVERTKDDLECSKPQN